MIKKNILLSAFCAFMAVPTMQAQLMEKSESQLYFENNKQLGGDVVIKSARIDVSGNNTYKIFEVEATGNGDYYLESWMNIPQQGEILPEYKVVVNGVEQESSFKSNKVGWQSVSLTNAKNARVYIKLKSGINNIQIVGNAPEIPKVEFVKLSTNFAKTKISSKEYDAYYEKIKTEQANVSTGINTLNLVSASSDTSNIFTRSVGTNGQEFNYALNVPINYTTFAYYSFTAGQKIEIRTWSDNLYQYIIECFTNSSPTTNSFGQYVSGNGVMTFTVPQTGIYLIRFRAYRQLIDGLVSYSILVNDRSVESMNNMPVSGFGITVPSGYVYSSDVNSFTCKTNSGADTYMWMQGSGNKILGFNDNFNGGGKFNWGNDSRINYGISGTVAALFSSYNSYTPATTCDVYVGLKNADTDVLSAFPDLDPLDAIRTAPYNSLYNCIAWSVGISDEWHWPGNTISSFDQYYSGYGYIRTSKEEEACIALWALNGKVTHASVRKSTTSDGFNLPHGYDWESKPGRLSRTLHPKDALKGYNYGQIVCYYMRNPNRSVNDFSVNRLEKAALNAEEELLISNVKSQLSSEFINEFEKLYGNWRNTWQSPEIAMQSDPRAYAKSEEYGKLLDFCNKYGKVTWYLFIEKLNNGDIFNINLLEDATMIAENKSLVDETKAKLANSRSVEDKYSLRTFAINYAKRLLDNYNTTILSEAKSTELNVKDFDFTLYGASSTIIVDVNVNITADVILQVVDIYGNTIVSKNLNKLSAGIHSFSFTVPNAGIYVVNGTTNGTTISKKIVIK